MAIDVNDAAARYQEALRAFIADGGEVQLERAYEIGRAMINAGRGVVELAGIHGKAVEAVLSHDDGKAARFLAEALAPFEMTLRGFEELNRTLEVRVQERTQELEKAQAMFHQAQKMETVGRLAGGVAHDFNNLLSVIMMNAELALSTLPPDDLTKQNIEEIFGATMRASALTRQLLAFSRKQMLAPTVLQLNDVVVGVEGMLRRLIGESINLRTELSPDVARVKADRGQIEQVIMNLVVNARDAMPGGGTVVITTSMRGAAVMLAVSDTGSGIDPAIIDRVFEPFFTTKGEGRGTGLGLATCYGIVHQSGGSIEVKSELGKGTRFDVVLPAADDDDGAAPERAVVGAATPSKSASILVVDDEPALLRATLRALESGGHRARGAGGGAEALALLADPAVEVDLLLTDVAMPDMGGRELVVEAMKIRPHMHVLYTSGYSDDEILARGVSTTEIDFLEKPVRPADLLAKVREILTR